MKWSPAILLVAVVSALPLRAQQLYSAGTATVVAVKREVVIDGSSTFLEVVTSISAGPQGALVIASGAEGASRFVDAVSAC